MRGDESGERAAARHHVRAGQRDSRLRDAVVSRRAVTTSAAMALVSAFALSRSGELEAQVDGRTQSAAARTAVDGRSVSWVAAPGHRVALTFDDGPDPRTTPAVLDILREHDVRATFFVVGRCVEDHPDIVRRMVDEGHTLANHTYDHAPLEQLTLAGVRDQLARGRAAIEPYATGPRLARPPRGYTSAVVARACAAEGEREIFWSACLESTHARTDAGRGIALADALVPGDIVLAHDGGHVPGRWAQSYDRSASVRALGPFLRTTRARGLALVPLPDLLAAGGVRA